MFFIHQLEHDDPVDFVLYKDIGYPNIILIFQLIYYSISISLNDTSGDINQMVYVIKELAGKVRAARKKKGLSQRAFAGSIGMPQSRLSKIENGLTDLQTSSLLELARSLDLELMLIPRPAVPAVNSLVRQLAGDIAEVEMTAIYDLSNGEEGDD